MNGLQVSDNMFDNGTIHTRVFRVVLRSSLPSLTLLLSRTIASNFDKAFSNARDQRGWKDLPIFSVSKGLITSANALVFFGSDLADNKIFLDASLAYVEDLFTTAEVLRLTPALIHPLISPILMRGHISSRTMVQYLMPVVEERLRRKHTTRMGDSSTPRATDCIQLFVDASNRRKEWTAQKIVQVLMGTWFAAVHQPALSLVYALHDLRDHPEYVSLLRQEILSGRGNEDRQPTSLEDLPLLDAFLKESCRLSPSDSISVRRKVLRPFTFADGTHILPGDVACVSLQAMMRDEHLHPDPLSFSPARFMATESATTSGILSETANRFTNADVTYPLWGLGKHSW